ncbi:hypothetical protein [Candidatus Frankia nodulisporulans]|uniref:hypothetical protein n=1 Tax=Candidatus Frankia nodulisporulans TaxID=2060052 RepID=UPI0013D12AAB|nr:hypothetical protein [Candidatus Frankia nodulisporulans]
MSHRHARYHGSVTDLHGQIFCVNACTCADDACATADEPRYELAQLDGPQLSHVRRASFTVVPDARDNQPGPWAARKD